MFIYVFLFNIFQLINLKNLKLSYQNSLVVYIFIIIREDFIKLIYFINISIIILEFIFFIYKFYFIFYK